jgi:hypothetical protein
MLFPSSSRTEGAGASKELTFFEDLLEMFNVRGVRRGVSKRVEDGRMPPTLREATTEMAVGLLKGGCP